MTNDDAGSGARTARRHDRQEGCLNRPRDPLPTRVEACPTLPAAYRDALDAALEALGIGVAAGARAAIDGHVRLLLPWNEAINLTAIRDPAAIAVRHVADSLTALAPLRARGVDRFLDLGSGGGFPGLPLAAALPVDRAVLIDSVAKKARFLETAVEAVGLAGAVSVAVARAETLARGPDRGRWPAVTARAVASLADLVELAFPLLGPRGVLVAWKRDDDVDLDLDGEPGSLSVELDGAARAVAAIDPGGRIELGPTIAGGPAIAGLAGHRLVFVERGRGVIGPAWPRDPAARRRRPW